MADDEPYVPTPEEVSEGEKRKRASLGDLIARVVRWSFRPGVGESKTVRTAATQTTHPQAKVAAGRKSLNVAGPQATSAGLESVQSAAAKNLRRRQGISIGPDVVRRRGEHMKGPSTGRGPANRE